MGVLKDGWTLWKLTRELDKLKGGQRACCMQILAEPPDHLEARRQMAALRGEPPPDREFCYEVQWFADMALPAKGYRGRSLGEALGKALEGTQHGLVPGFG